MGGNMILLGLTVAQNCKWRTDVYLQGLKQSGASCDHVKVIWASPSKPLDLSKTMDLADRWFF